MRMLFPNVATRQNEHRDIARVNICKRSRRLDLYSTHRLYQVHAKAHGLDTITPLTPKLGDGMSGLPVRETRKYKQADNFVWHLLDYIESLSRSWKCLRLKPLLEILLTPYILHR